jgi:hypothetical protein
MAQFDAKSRYVKYAQVYTTIDRRGRMVSALTPALVPPQATLGVHRRKQGQRLDHLAAFYLQDPLGYWRLCAANGVMLPEALSERDMLDIPTVI